MKNTKALIVITCTLLWGTACGSGIFDALDELKDKPAMAITPADADYLAKSSINSEIVITFKKSMTPSTLTLDGDLAPYAQIVWSSTTRGDDTLTLTPQTGAAWPVSGEKTLVISCEDLNGNRTEQTLRYRVVDALRYVCTAANGGSDSNDGSRARPLQTVNAAITAVKNTGLGTVSAVLISEGEYSSTTTIADLTGFAGDVVLRGGYAADWSECDPATHETVLMQQGLGAVCAVSANVAGFTSASIIENLTITNTGYKSSSDTETVSLNGAIILRNCDITAIASEKSSGYSVAVRVNEACSSTIEDNIIRMNSANGTSYGIFSYQKAQLAICGNTIYFQKSTTVGTDVIGIMCQFPIKYVVSKNRIMPATDSSLIGTGSSEFSGMQFTVKGYNPTIVVDGNTVTLPQVQSVVKSWGCFLSNQFLASPTSANISITNNTLIGTGDNTNGDFSNGATALEIEDKSTLAANYIITGNTLVGTGKKAVIGGSSTGLVITNKTSNFTIAGNAIAGCGAGTDTSNRTSVFVATGLKYSQSVAGAPQLTIDNNTICGLNSFSEDKANDTSFSRGVFINTLQSYDDSADKTIITNNTIIGRKNGSHNNDGSEFPLKACLINASNNFSCQIKGNTILGQETNEEGVCTGTTIYGLEVSGAATGGLSRLAVINNTIAGGYNGDTLRGVFINFNSSVATEISGNTITGMCGDDTGTALSNATGLYLNASAAKVYNNRVIGSASAIKNAAPANFYGSFSNYSQTCTVYYVNNVIVPAISEVAYSSGKEYMAIKVNTAQAGSAFHLLNNTIIAPRHDGASPVQLMSIPTYLATVTNNIIVMNSDTSTVFGDIPGGLALNNNCIYREAGCSTDNKVYYRPPNSYYDVQENTGRFIYITSPDSNTSGNTIVTVSPLADIANQNYALTAATPEKVRTSGADLSVTFSTQDIPLTDITGKARPAGSWSMGAYQY